MKKKILASLMLLVLVFTNYVFAANTVYPRQGGYMLTDHATVFNDSNHQLYLPNTFNANSQKTNDVEIYYANGDQMQIDYNDSHFIASDGYGYYRLKLEPDSVAPHAITFKYKNGIKYGNELYNVKVVIGEIRVDGGVKNETTQPELRVRVQSVSEENNTITPTDAGVYPHIYVIPTEGGKVEIDVDYYVYKEEDNQEKSVAVNGVFELTDIDLQQGIVIGGYESNPDNTYIKEHTTQYINIVTNSNYTHLYSLLDRDLGINEGDPNCDVYLKMENFRHGSLVFTYEDLKAGSNLRFKNDIYKNYHTITTSVEGGTITPTPKIENITDGENKKITYTPGNNKYLKSIKVDNQLVDVSTYPNSYTFSNITEDHTIHVVYGDKYKVEFVSNCDTQVPTQWVIPSEKAREPAEPTKEGYTFKGWYTDSNFTTEYDFNNPVNENKKLYAKWEKDDVYHNISYVIVGTPTDNNASNPNKYKEGDTTALTINNPTKSGYTFSGWYENQNLTGTPVTRLNISNRTSDITLYGKWTKDPDPVANYTVRHYLEDDNGTVTKNGKKYKLDNNSTQTKSSTVGSTVSENAKSYVGYTANDNSLSGTVKQDGSLELDFYYDKNEYLVTFDPQGGTPAPGQQTKKYGETVTKPTNPTKNGYTFKYWYDRENGSQSPYSFTTPVTSNKTLVAKWEEVIPEDKYHNINYIIDGTPDNSAGNPDKYKEGTTEPITINNPTKTGYTFSGWYENQSLTGTSKTSLDVSNKTSDITLYGKWTKNENPKGKYAVIHYLEDENGTTEKDGKKYKLDKTDNKELDAGSTFTEYAESYEGYEAEKASQSGKVEEDEIQIICFFYNKKQYTVTFDTKGGNPVPDSQTKKYGEKVDKPTNPTKDGYNFLYWYEEVDGKKVIYDFDKPVKSDKDLIAAWEEIKIVPDDSKEETKKEEVPAKEDSTTSEQKVLPKTGIIGTTLFSMLAIAIAGIIFAIKYHRLRDIK